MSTAGVTRHDLSPAAVAAPGEAEAARLASVAVVIPCHRVRPHILDLLGRIGPEVQRIFVVDDACPEASGTLVLERCHDPRVVVAMHETNQGVGGALVTGYRLALEAGADVVVKLDGDGQMDPELIPLFVAPILDGRADYVKGNRFFYIEDVKAMPRVRLVGNAVLSFMTRASSGYWNMFDPTNGYTAVAARTLSNLPLHRLSRRYFFESDMLFRLGTLQAAVTDLPMAAVYGEERSGLRIRRVLWPFLAGNLGNLGKRIFYRYFLRGFSVASIELVTGLLLLAFGVAFGIEAWGTSIATGKPATSGTVILAALPTILGVQLLLAFLAVDTAPGRDRAIAGLLPRRVIGPHGLPKLRLLRRCG